ncbi:unnamed protein product [Anisakis simplex]|uniref:DUF3012 domain-containing protein n=1 Tax=Anisakis simplex TaxID=6269 RepID=A0A0M3IZ03_ANISI|nr:unnamed protein product [Anisakis simplex]
MWYGRCSDGKRRKIKKRRKCEDDGAAVFVGVCTANVTKEANKRMIRAQRERNRDERDSIELVAKRHDPQ